MAEAQPADQAAPTAEPYSLAFLSLALAVDLRTDLNDFGKGAALMIALLALMLEAGATSVEIGEYMRKIQIGALRSVGKIMMVERDAGQSH